MFSIVFWLNLTGLDLSGNLCNYPSDVLEVDMLESTLFFLIILLHYIL